jgi:hypothetical protein
MLNRMWGRLSATPARANSWRGYSIASATLTTTLPVGEIGRPTQALGATRPRVSPRFERCHGVLGRPLRHGQPGTEHILHDDGILDDPHGQDLDGDRVCILVRFETAGSNAKDRDQGEDECSARFLRLPV